MHGILWGLRDGELVLKKKEERVVQGVGDTGPVARER